MRNRQVVVSAPTFFRKINSPPISNEEPIRYQCVEYGTQYVIRRKWPQRVLDLTIEVLNDLLDYSEDPNEQKNLLLVRWNGKIRYLDATKNENHLALLEYKNQKASATDCSIGWTSYNGLENQCILDDMEYTAPDYREMWRRMERYAN